MGSLTDCATTESKKSRKNVKFSDNPTTIVGPSVADPDGNLIFHMYEKEIKANVQKKSELYEESSIERKFIRAIADVIQSNYGMYEKLYRYMNGLCSYNTEISQIRRKGIDASDHIFPDRKTFKKLVQDKGSFKQKLNILLSWLEPSYKMNEHSIQMINSMDADTKIDLKLYNEMADEAKKVGEINGSFEKLFQSFPMENYKKNLDLIRKATGFIEDQILVKKVPKVAQICPLMKQTVSKMKKTLKTALTIEFEELYAATKKVHGIVMEALKVNEDA